MVVEVSHKDSIIKIITAFYPHAKIYLFGSYAYGRPTQSSDVDIAIDVGKKLDIHEKGFLFNLLEALPIVQRIELVDLQSVKGEFKEAILREGVIWHS